MNEEWINCKLVDACDSVDYGLTESASKQNKGFQFLRITDIVPGYVDWNKVPYVDIDTSLYTKYKLNQGDIVIARTGASTGASCYIKNPSKSIFASYLVRLKIKSSFDSQFLSYYLKSNFFWRFVKGVLGDKSAQPNASASTLTQAPLFAPKSKSQQRAIAHILGTLDDKIELNRQMNQTLEEMARALFKSWFVDFDPVREKAAGRAPVGMDAQTAALFPDQFEDSELGEIPKGWRVDTLATFAQLNPNSWSRQSMPDQIQYIDLANTKWGKIESPTPYLRQDAPSRAQRILNIGDTIIGTVRPGNGSYALVSTDGLTGSTGFAVLKPIKTIFREFVYFVATSKENIDRLAHLADGAAYPAVRPDVVLSTPCLSMQDSFIESFSKITSQMMVKISVNDQESKTLTALRDTLLPKLISGEVRVKDAEGFLAERGL